MANAQVARQDGCIAKRIRSNPETPRMAQPTPQTHDGNDKVPPAVVAAALAAAREADAMHHEWGYESADPALLARLWGEPVAQPEDL
jgi:hypothetical protein